MTKAISKVQKSEEVYNLVNEIAKAKRAIGLSFLLIGRNLYAIKEKNLFKYYGEHIESFNDFLKEINIKRASGYNYIAVYKTFGQIIEQKNLDVEYTRLLKLLPIVKKKGEKEEWLYKAQDLPVEAFANEIREAKGKIPMDKCDCPEDEQIIYTRCNICNKWRKRDINYLKEYVEKISEEIRKKM
jgi:hypothetical protein